MYGLVRKLSPTITHLIRTDHKAVAKLFHKYEKTGNEGTKRAIANTLSVAIGTHAELEQELLYPPMRQHMPELIEHSIPEHARMFERIAELQNSHVVDERFDEVVRALKNEVQDHVREEEEKLLPAAERFLAGELQSLGAEWNRRRMTLAKPVAGKAAWNAARSMPAVTIAVGALALVAGVLGVRRALRG